MGIDIFTLVIVLATTHAIQLVIFSLEYYTDRRFEGLKWWMIWSLCAITGFTFMFLRQIKAIEVFSILIQNVMLISAYMAINIGLIKFLGLKIRKRLLIVLYVLFISLFYYYLLLDDDMRARMLLFWIFSGIISFLVAYDLFLCRLPEYRMNILLAIILFLFHGLFSWTKVILLMGGVQFNSFSSNNLFNIASFIEVLIITMLWTFVFISLIHRRLNLEVERAKLHFEVIFNTSPNAILITEVGTGIATSVNDKFYELSGYSPSDLIGKSTNELGIWLETGEKGAYLDRILKEGHVVDFEAQFVKRDGTVATGLISGRLIQLHDKPHVINIIKDISERIRNEEKIIRQNKELQRINEEKDKFFSVIAHDLKSPFSIFLGLTEIMSDEISSLPPDEIAGLAVKMRDSARNLYGLLENLLEWSMLQRGVTHFMPTQTLLFPEIKESIATYQAAAQKKNIHLQINVPVVITVKADINMLRSLLRNLISNAIKFTRSGGVIAVSAELLPNGSCLIKVEDNGVGMNPALKDQLFSLGKNTSRKGTEGELSTGLGLLICKEFVQLHQGKIWVESKEGEGSSFFILLPGEVNLS
ncbi:MAG: PAS domain-containing sensor histidine kinase [Marinilabiliales bacterium]|nr:PAS domain-containing sensor histidine kinase [Marinilabiliales bacterium]